MRKLAFALTCSLGLSACSTNNYRGPTSAENLNLHQLIEQIKIVSKREKIKTANCSASYNQLYQSLFDLAGDTTYLDLNNLVDIDHDIEAAFLARLELKDNFQNFASDTQCLKSATDVYRALRYVEDYLVELRAEKSWASPDYVDLKGEFPYLLVNPKYASDFKSYEDLKSGDIILSRGNAFSSAAIARIGINDYQFSHLSFVYKDPKTLELFTSEAHIEIGSVTAPLIEHIKSGNSRSVVYRYKDEDVAARASQKLYERVLTQQQTKKNIEYDFTMDFKDNNKLFCSEIITSGFKDALPNEDYFPMFKSKLSPGILPFLNRIGVPVNKENIGKFEIFAPGDIQLDPRFEVVAEWRNPKKTEESRIKDFILTKLFDYMDKEGHKFDPNFKMDAKAKTLWLLRRVPLVKKLLEEKFPLNMNTDQLELFMALDKVGDVIYKEVEKAALEFDRPMTPKEIYGVLDDFFKRDFELYKRYKKGQDVVKPAFHLLFHP